MTQAVAKPVVPSSAAPALPMYRFSVAQYQRMVEKGILTENDRVELLEGWIVAKMPHNPPHDGTILMLQTALLALLPSEWVLRIQSSLVLRDSLPEPDLVVARGPARRYLQAHPRPRDAGLVIEVADASLGDDRVIKGRMYARARVPVYWLVNIPDGRIEVYTQPRAGRSPEYRQRDDYQRSDTIPLILDGRQLGTVSVRDVLP